MLKELTGQLTKLSLSKQHICQHFHLDTTIKHSAQDPAANDIELILSRIY